MGAYFHPFVPDMVKLYWEGFASPRMGYHSGYAPTGTEFETGLLVAVRHGFMDTPHIHDGTDNFFLFCGTHLDRLWEDEFEVDLFMGDSAQHMEMYKITRPTLVRVPAGVWHTPIYYRNCGRGVTNLMWYKGFSAGRVYPGVDENGEPTEMYEKDNWIHPCKLDPERNCVYCGKCFNQTEEYISEFMKPIFEGMSSEHKYTDCVIELKPDYHSLGDGVASPRAVIKLTDMPGFLDREFSLNAIVKPCVLGENEAPVCNGHNAEYLWFSGADALDPWNSFDAELEILVGEDPDHMETVVIDRPGLVIIEPGKWRGALTAKRIGKPVFFEPWYLGENGRYKLTEKELDGKKVRVFDDSSTITEPNQSDELYMFLKK